MFAFAANGGNGDVQPVGTDDIHAGELTGSYILAMTAASVVAGMSLTLIFSVAAKKATLGFDHSKRLATEDRVLQNIELPAHVGSDVHGRVGHEHQPLVIGRTRRPSRD